MSDARLRPFGGAHGSRMERGHRRRLQQTEKRVVWKKEVRIPRCISCLRRLFGRAAAADESLRRGTGADRRRQRDAGGCRENGRNGGRAAVELAKRPENEGRTIVVLLPDTDTCPLPCLRLKSDRFPRRYWTICPMPPGDFCANLKKTCR